MEPELGRDKDAKYIFNPITGKYYKIMRRSSVYGNAGDIKGLWTTKRKGER